MNKSLTLKLGMTALEKKWGRRESLGDLIDRALRVIRPDEEPSDTAPWLARRAIEAVCEEIIRTGKMNCPLKVLFVTEAILPHPPRGWTPPPGLFGRN